MSQRGDIKRAVIACPGINLDGVAQALGLTTKHERKVLSTQLSRMCQLKKLRKDSIIDRDVGKPRFWPTDTTATDQRLKPAGVTAHAARAAKKLTPAKTSEPKPPTRAAMRALISAEARAKSTPKPEPTARFIPPPQKPNKHGPRNAQSVDEFIRRGGRIEYLEHHSSSNPLRFDHSQTQVPIGKRRPSICHRPAPGR